MTDLNDEYAGMVKELLEYDGDKRMTTWELDFIEDNARRDRFSDKQKAVIQKIYDKVFS